MRWIVRIAVVVLLAVVVMRLRERQADVAATADGLDVDRQGIVHTEGYVGDLDARIDQAAEEARDLDRQVTAFEARHPDGIPAAARAEYERILTRRNEVVAEHNDLIARRRTAVEEYDRRVAGHNDRVEGQRARRGEHALADRAGALGEGRRSVDLSARASARAAACGAPPARPARDSAGRSRPG